MPRILAISGSLRQASLNTALLRAAQELAPPGMAISLYPGLGALPPYNQDVELAGDPAPVADLKAAVRAADALLIATPEYNYAVPGVLKNALDWLSRPAAASPLKGKPAAILGVSLGGGGTARAQLVLRQSFLFTETYAMLKPEFALARASEKFDAAGRLTDESTRQRLAEFLQALAAWSERWN
ncbi:MAG TPA: NADPH-dependent FMN reductase [Terriglobales bacterium]|nr:NADPH-dependent FMN reductase [Terriglobales bacterium]